MITLVECVGAFWVGAALGYIASEEDTWVLTIPAIITITILLYLAGKGLGI